MDFFTSEKDVRKCSGELKYEHKVVKQGCSSAVYYLSLFVLLHSLLDQFFNSWFASKPWNSADTFLAQDSLNTAFILCVISNIIFLYQSKNNHCSLSLTIAVFCGVRKRCF